ncbi:response regulator [Venatoribacter cucullus]|nr:response regulator [Venatoribacter cucullus]
MEYFMQRTLLLVDDESGITDAIKRMLRGEPWQILQASNADEALQMFGQHSIHLLITDYKMPGTDGLTLCRQVRERSPATYRLLLSGQVDYAALRLAWQNGDIHRFVAKPWDNLLLTLDIHEGLRQQQLLQHSNHLQQQLSQQELLLLTDENWVVRHANEPLCRLLNCQPADLHGINLFAPALSAMPVSLETEVTHQTEQQQSWLGIFTFQRPHQAAMTTRMTISPLGPNFRLCLCQPVTGTLAPERGLQDELQRYSGEHHLQRLQQDAGAQAHDVQLLVITFPPGEVSNRDVASICFERLQVASGDRYNIYSPQPQSFLLLLPADLDPVAQHALQQAIRLQFEQPLQLQQRQQPLHPQLSLEQKPADIDCWTDWLRQRLGMPRVSIPAGAADSAVARPVVTPTRPTTPVQIRPVFNRSGRLVAVELPPPDQRDQADWYGGLQELQQRWQPLFGSPMKVLLNVSQASRRDTGALLQALNQLPGHSWQGFARISEADLLDQSDAAIAFRDQLRGQHCQLLLQQFGQGFLNPRQILQQPIAGVCMTAEFLSQLRNRKVTQQSRRLLQKLHEQPLLLYADRIDSPEQLAAAHLNQLDWLAGDLLSPLISAEQLQWFAGQGDQGA